MKAILKIFTLLSVIFCLAAQVIMGQSNSGGALRINPDNPHYFKYKGNPIFLITDASNLDQGSGRSNGFNHKTIINITATSRPNMPYNSENINSGWNQGNWNNLKDAVSRANDRDIIIGIMFWSTPMLEAYEGRWATHLWNERNGGPIPDDRDGKDEFYTLHSYGSEITEPYSQNWSWQKRNQFRQEELVKKYLEELKDFPNVYFISMFEIGDHYGSSLGKARQWHQHISRVVTSRQPNRLIGTVISTGGEHEVAGWSEVDILLFEGPGIPSSSKLKEEYWSFNKPLVWQFIHPNKPNNPEGQMRDAVINGLQPADILRGGSSGQNNYALAIANFMKTIGNWCDEPGQEITKNTVPSPSGGGGVDLSPGSCSDSGGGGNVDITPPSSPKGVKVSETN